MAICTEHLRDPRYLPCLHTFCFKCLTTVVDIKGEGPLPCPVCRKDCYVPAAGVSGFPVNFHANNLLSALNLRSGKDQVDCDECAESEVAIARCSTCFKFLCDIHAKAHPKARVTKDHQVTALDDLRNSPSLHPIQRPLSCSTHGKKFKLFCETCDRPICRDCALVEHRDHKYRFLKDAAAEHKGVVARLAAETEKHLPSLESAVKGVCEMSALIVNRNRATHEHIDQSFSVVIAALAARRNSLKSDCDAIAKEREKVLTGQKSGLEDILAEIRSSCEFVRRALGNGSDVEVLSMKSSMMRRLKELNDKSFELTPAVRNDFDVTLNPGSLLAGIGRFGALIRMVGDPAKSTVTGDGLASARVGKVSSFLLLVRDRQGKRATAGGDSVGAVVKNDATKEEINALVVDNGDGSYRISYTPCSFGKYWVTVTLNGFCIARSPFAVTAAAEAVMFHKDSCNLGISINNNVATGCGTITCTLPPGVTQWKFRFDATPSAELAEFGVIIGNQRLGWGQMAESRKVPGIYPRSYVQKRSNDQWSGIKDPWGDRRSALATIVGHVLALSLDIGRKRLTVVDLDTQQRDEITITHVDVQKVFPYFSLYSDGMSVTLLD